MTTGVASPVSEVARVLVELAGLHRDYSEDEPSRWDAILVVAARALCPPQDNLDITELLRAESEWHQLVNGVRPRDLDYYDDDGSELSHAAALEQASAHLAYTLWGLLHPGDQPCGTCLDVLGGQPWQIAVQVGRAVFDGLCGAHGVARAHAQTRGALR
jgi:hypothetical protein